MSIDKINIQHIVQLGFIAIVGLMLIAGGIGIYQLHLTNLRMTVIVDNNNTKTELANKMRTAIRLRQISIISMLSMDDVFQRDTERLRFYEYSGVYRKARKQLISMPMDTTEQDIHKYLTEITKLAQPLNQEAVELLIEEAPRNVIKDAVNRAQQEQNVILALLTKLISLQKKYAQEALIDARQKYNQSLLIVLVLGLFSIIGGYLIASYISRFVSQKNAQLEINNQELATASALANTATQSKSAFLATMSHEIRTPLTAIIGFAETLLDNNQSQTERTNSINTIIRSGKHLLQIINDILDLSKIEAHKLELEKMPFSPFDLLIDLSTLASSHARKKDLEFELQYEFPLPKTITSDPLRLKQILLNLTNNAIKFTQSGRVNVIISCDKENQLINFEVTDTGIGMTPEQTEKVFEAFTQADSSTTRKYGGTGLGLALSKELTEKLGGTLTFESLKNVGSRFNVTIATGSLDNIKFIYDKNQIELMIQDTLTAPIQNNSLQGHILLAEDNIDNQQLLTILIKKTGATVSVVDNGKIAVEQALQHDFDLVIMDMQMPLLGGPDATRLLRRSGFTKPIIALTANAMKQDKEECISAGCNDFLTKPVDRIIFYNTLSRFLKTNYEKLAPDTSFKSTIIDSEPDFQDIIFRFIKKLPTLMDDIKHNANQQDWDKLSAIVHQLKGTGGGMGYPLLTQIAGEIHHQITKKNYSEVDQLINTLETVTIRIITANNNSSKQETPNVVSLPIK